MLRILQTEKSQSGPPKKLIQYASLKTEQSSKAFILPPLIIWIEFPVIKKNFCNPCKGIINSNTMKNELEFNFNSLS